MTELQTTSPASFDVMKNEAKILSGSQLIPANYQGKPEDCYVALRAARRMGCDPLLFLQNTYVVHGRPAQSAKFQIALVNQSGRLKGGLRWRISDKGDYQAWGIDADTGEEIVGPVVNMALARAEKWDKNPKYKSMPDLMLRYRSATMFIGLHFPEITMGFQSAEEIHDMNAAGQLAPTPGGQAGDIPDDILLESDKVPGIPDKDEAEDAEVTTAGEGTQEPDAEPATEDVRPEDLLAAEGDPEVLGQPQQGGLL